MKSQRIVEQKKVVTGTALIAALGFGSARAFQRARQAGQIEVKLYPIPGQSRGLYALQADIDQWSAARAMTASAPQTACSPKPNGGKP